MVSSPLAIRNGISAVPFVHTATPLVYAEAGTDDAWVEGERTSEGIEPVSGVPFPCALFLPAAGGAQNTPTRLRQVTVPTLLFNPLRADGSVIELGNETELMITAPEFEPWLGAPVVRWQVQGRPQPFGPPGSVIGVLATLQRVED